MTNADTVVLGGYAPAARFRGVRYRSFYAPVRDGTRLAVDVILPGDVGGERLPAILIQTRYWRVSELRAPFKWFLRPDQLSVRLRAQVPFLTSHGYALVLVDVRGTGASFGVWPHPWAEESMADAYDLVEWIIRQSWSNGKVGGMGVSYLGTTAELLATIGHPAVKCTLPMFNHPDAYTDIAFPGGVMNDRFLYDWGLFDKTLDGNRIPREAGLLAGLFVKGVKPVEGSEHLLAEAVKEHAANGDVHRLAQAATFRDDRIDDRPPSMEDVAVHRYADGYEASEAAVLGWGSWMDAGTADAVLRRFATHEQAGRAIIGAWEHGGTLNASPYRTPGTPVSPALPEQLSEMLRFFDAYLKEMDTGVRGEKVLYYYTLGAERWQATASWPPAGVQMQRWHLGAQQRLAQQPPAEADGEDRFAVDFEATSGGLNRWWEMGGILQKPVTYADRAAAAQHMLTYFTPPLERDVEIAGYPVVTLYVTSTATDGAFMVYLEDVDPVGKVTYVTEGELRAIHRRVSDQQGPYRLHVPYHSFKRKDAMPLVPGEVAELTFGLNPISAVIKQGHRIRIGIAGHDKGTFARIPETGMPTITIAHNAQYASFIDLPVKG
ncbi:MAG: CocE/NonD family hydrolase [Anaerolineae bacterium]